MRNIILPVAIILVLLVSSFIFIPYLFKDKIISAIKVEANGQLKGQLDFDDDIGINIFKTFPNLNITVNDLVLRHEDSCFTSDALLAIKSTNLSIDLMEFYRNQNYIFRSLELNNPILSLEATDTLNNWDIFREKQDSSTTDASSFVLSLEDIRVIDGKFSYLEGPTEVFVSNIDHSSTGVYSEAGFNMEAKTKAKRVQVIYDDIAYLDNWEIQQLGQIDLNLTDDIYSFPSNELIINGLHTDLNGDITLDEEDILFDLKAAASNSNLNEILTLIPAIYTSEYEDIISRGNSSFTTSFIGKYNELSFPAYSLRAKIDNGYFKYPDLPLAMEDMNVSINIFSKDGTANSTIIDIPTIAFKVKDDPFSGRLIMSQIFTSPVIDLSAHGEINLEMLSSLIPIEGLELKGKIDGDLDIKGALDDIQKSEVNKFTASGEFLVEDLYYKSSEMKKALDVTNGHLAIRNQGVTIDKLIGKLGDNDVDFYGRFDRFFSYIFNDEPLEGMAVLTSNRFNLNDFYASNESKESGTAEMTLVEIPGNLKLQLSAAVDQLQYDDLIFDNFTGSFQIEDKKFTINDLATTFLDGRLDFSGLYAYDPSVPFARFDITYSEIELHRLLDKFSVMTAFAPLAEKIESISSAKLKFSSPLALDMSPKLDQVDLSGILSLRNISVDDNEVFKSLDKKLGTNHFNEGRLKDMLLNFSLKEGKLFTQPFNIRADQANLELSGVSKLDQTIDYTGKLFVPSVYVENEVERINELLKNSNIKNFEIKPNEFLEIDVLIIGKIGSPDVSLNLKEIRKSFTQAVKDSVSAVIEEKKDEVKDQLTDKANELKKEGEKKIDDAKKKVQDELDAKRKEAEDKLKLEAEEKRKKLKEEAKKKLKNIFK